LKTYEAGHAMDLPQIRLDRSAFIEQALALR
jgi:hypothetical protein